MELRRDAGPCSRKGHPHVSQRKANVGHQRHSSHLRVLAADCHLVPVERLFHDVEGVIADLVVSTHVENSLTCGVECCTMSFGVCGTALPASFVHSRRKAHG